MALALSPFRCPLKRRRQPLVTIPKFHETNCIAGIIHFGRLQRLSAGRCVADAAWKNSLGLWKDFVPVAWHVDYWDSLGWRDRWSE